MKILQLGKFYPIRGGVEKVMLDLTTGLSAAGVPCDMLCATTEKAGVFPVGDRGRVIAVKAWGKVAATMIAPAMIGWLRAHRNEYDLIHIHHPDPMAALALRLSGFKGPVVMHWHSDIVSQKFFLWLYKPLQNWVIRRASRIVGTTPVYVRESPHLQNAQDKCGYIPIGIEPVSFDAEKTREIRARYPERHLLLSVGRLVPYKGYSCLLDAMRLLSEDYHLVIVGTGPLKESLEKQIRDNGLTERVTLAGFVSDEDLPGLFGACDALVLASVMKTEAFAIVQIEAMSAGKPVVSTTIPGSGVAWVNSCGITVPPSDAEALAAGIRNLTETPGALETYGKAAREHFGELFTLDKMIQKTIQLYHENIAL